MLFTVGYGYVAVLVASEQAARRREARAVAAPPPPAPRAPRAAPISEPPPASGEQLGSPRAGAIVRRQPERALTSGGRRSIAVA